MNWLISDLKFFSWGLVCFIGGGIIGYFVKRAIPNKRVKTKNG
jgi:hypothetical protein